MKSRSEIFVVVKPLHNATGNVEGNVLSIMGKEYNAWNYDWYIYDAIDMARKWKYSDITYDRILHLRNWIRENYQHGHNINYTGIRSLRGAKKFVEQVIIREYCVFNPDDDIWKEQREFSLRKNREIFSPN